MSVWFRWGHFWLILWVIMVPLIMGGRSLLDKDTLIAHFEVIAFGNEYTHERFPRVRKWKNPIRIGVQGAAPEFLDADIRQHVDDLHRLTGHDMALIYSENMRKSGMVADDFDTRQLNVVVYFIPQGKIHKTVLRYFDHKKEQVDQMIRSSTCFAKFFKKGDEIRAAIVVIPSQHSRETVRACVIEELAQIMGLPNDSDAVTGSIFKDKSGNNELTQHDRTLLALLYDKRILVGMVRDDALAMARRILDEGLVVPP